MPVMVRSRIRLLAAVVASAIAGLSCGERITAPQGLREVAFAVAPTFTPRASAIDESLAIFGLDVDNIHIVLTRAGGQTALDTTVAFPAGIDSVAITLTLQISGNSELFSALIELRQGSTVLFSGTQGVTLRVNPPTGGNAPTIPIDYVGPGSEAEVIHALPADTTVGPGAAFAMRAVALDDQGDTVTNARINWRTLDAAIGTVDSAGNFSAVATRGNARIVAKLPNLVEDTAIVRIVPPATQLVVFSGGGQTGVAGSALAAPIVVEVRAADNLPVPGVTVNFAVDVGGGNVTPPSAVGDSLGRVSATFTLGTGVGVQSIRATSSGLPDLVINATSEAGAATQIVILDQPQDTATVGVGLDVAPRVELRDAFGNARLVAGTNVSVALSAPGGGAIAGTTTVATDANGQATFAGLQINALVGQRTLSFTSGALPAAVSDTIVLVRGPAALLTVEGGTAFSTPVGDTIALSHAVRVTDAGTNPIDSFPLTLDLPDDPDTTVVTDSTGRWLLRELGPPENAGVYPLIFSGAGLTPVTITVTVTPGSPTSMVFAQAPSDTAVIGNALLQQPHIQLKDAFGNSVAQAGVSIEAEIVGAGRSLTGTEIIATNAAGQAIFTNLAIIGAAGEVQLRFVATGLDTLVSDTILLFPALATDLEFTLEPSAPMAGTPFSVTVTAKDGFGNVDLGFTGNVTVALGANPGGSTLGGTKTIAAVAGVASFNDLTLNNVSTGYTLVATSAGLAPDTTGAFAVITGVTYHDERRPGDIAIYKNIAAWFGENKDETVLQAAPFMLAPAIGDYSVHPMADLQSGIPGTTSLVILTSASDGDAAGQIDEQQAAFAQLDTWVRNGGWLVVHAGDNYAADGYQIPGLTGIVDADTACTGLAPAMADHAFIRGPDALLGTADDIVPFIMGVCSDNHGSLEGILPGNAEVLLREDGDLMRAVYATYTLGAGRVIVTTQSIEFVSHSTQALINHFYWAINGVNAPPAQPVVRMANWLGGDGNWSDGTKWNLGVPPAPTDSVRIVGTDSFTVTLDQSATVGDLRIGGAGGLQTLSMPSGWTLTVNSLLRVSAGTGHLAVANGTISGTGTVAVFGTMVVGDANLNNTGQLRVESGATMTLNASGQMDRQGGGAWIVDGALNWSSGGVFLHNGSALQISPSGTLSIAGNASMGQGSGGGSLVNAGAITRHTAPGLVNLALPVFNNGSVEVQSGELRVGASGTFASSGTWEVDSFAVLSFIGGNATLNGNVTGAGTLVSGSGTQTFAGGVSVGNLTAQGGTVMNVTSPTAVSDLFLQSGGTTNLNSGALVTTTRFHQLAGTLQGADTLVVLDEFDWQGGAMSGAGATRIVDTATASFTTANGKTLNTRLFDLRGAAVWTDGAIGLTNSQFVVAATATLDITADLSISASGTGAWINNGLVRKTGGTVLFTTSAPYTNNGVTEVLSGRFRLSASSTTTHAGAWVSTQPSGFDFQSGTHTLNGPMRGDSRLNVFSGTVTANDTLQLSSYVHTNGNLNALGTLLVADSLRLVSGTLTVSTGENVHLKLFEMTGGTLQGVDTVVVDDSLRWNGGTMGGLGATRVDTLAVATLATTTGRALVGGRRFEIRAPLVWSDGTWSVSNASFVDIAPSGSLSIAGNPSMTAGTGGGTLQNAGVFQKTAGTGLSAVSIAIASTGTINVQTGTLRFASPAGTWTTAGTINTSAGATVEYQSGTHNINAAIGGSGTMSVTTATVNVLGALAPAHLLQSGGTLTLGAGLQHAVPKLTQSGGTLQGTDTITVTDSLIWPGGTMAGTGTTIVHDTASAYLATSSGRTLQGGRSFVLRGFLNHELGTFSINNGSVFTVDTAAQYLFTGAVNVSTSTTGSMVNNGIVAKPIGAGIAAISVAFTNNGNVAASAGTLRIGQSSGNYTHTGDFAVTAPGAFEFTGASQNAQGTIAGTGSFSSTGNAVVNISGGYFLPALIAAGTGVNFTTGSAVSIPTVSLLGGTIGGTDSLIVTDSLYWSAGEFSGAGTTAVVDTGVATFTTGNNKLLSLGRTLSIGGLARHDAGQVQLGGASTLRIESGGTYELRAGIVIQGTAGSGTVINDGQFVRTGTAGAATVSATFVNNGTVDVLVSSLAFTQTVSSTHSGTMTINAPGAFTVSNGIHTFDGGLTGTGTFIGSGGTVQFNQPFALPMLTASGATITLAAGASALDTLRISGGTLTATGGGEFGTKALLMTGGTLQGTDTVTVLDSLDWAGGAMQGTGRTVVVDSAVARFTTTTRTLGGGRAFDLDGTATWSAGTLTVANGSPFNISPTGELFITGNVVLNNSVGGIVNNLGAVRRTGGTGTTTIGAPFENDGLVEVLTGTTAFTSPSTHTHSGAWIANATLEIGGGTHTMDSSIVGTGIVRFNATSVTANDAVAVGSLVSLSGTATLNGAVSALDTVRAGTGTIAFNGGAAVPIKRLFIAGGTVGGTDSLIVLDSMEWSSGTHTGAGVTRLLDTVPLILSTTSTKFQNGARAVIVDGDARWSAGTWQHGGGSLVHITGTGDLEVTGNVTVTTTTGGGLILNDGSIRRTAGTGGFSVNSRFQNNGTVETFTGQTFFTTPDTVVHTGSWHPQNSTMLTVGGQMSTFNGPFSGTGRVTLSGSLPTSLNTFNDTIDVGTLLMAAGVSVINGPVLPLDSLQINGGTSITFATGSPVLTDVYLQPSGLRLGADTIVVLDSMIWQGGIMGGTGVTTVAPSAIARFESGTKTLQDSHNLVVEGVGTWLAGGITTSNTASLLAVAPGGTLNITAALTMGGSGNFLNQGTTTKTGAGALAFNVGVFNHGLFSVTAGSVTISPTGGTKLSLGQFDVADGTSLTFGGTSVTNTLDPASSITGAGIINFSGGTNVMNGSLTARRVNYTLGSLRIGGTVNVTDSLTHNVPASPIVLTSNVTIPAGQRWYLNSTGGLNDSSGVGSLTVNGELVKKANSTTVNINVPVTVNGTLGSSNGVFNFTRGFDLPTSGIIFGDSTFTTNAVTVIPDSVGVWDGALAPGKPGGIRAGMLTLNGGVVGSPTAEIRLEIGGLTPRTQHDQLVLTSTAASFTGPINVTLINGFTPTSGMTFTVMTYPAGTPVPNCATQFSLPAGMVCNATSTQVVISMP